VAGHALRNLDAPAVCQVVRDARGAESVAADARLDAGGGRTMYPTSVRDIRTGPSFLVSSNAARNNGPCDPARSPAASI